MDDGVEGGSWDRIEDWPLARVEAMHSSRRRNGPSLRIAVQVVGQALGIDWPKLTAGQTDGAAQQDAPAGPTIAEIAAMGLAPL